MYVLLYSLIPQHLNINFPSSILTQQHPSYVLFPYFRLFKIRIQRLLLDIFIQIGSRVVDTVVAGTGIIKVLLQR